MLYYSFLCVALVSSASAHVAAWVPGMFCQGGPDPTIDEQNTNTAGWPLYNLTVEEWWMQADRGCNLAPPKNGTSLELPAGKSFRVELSHNRGQTTMSFDGRYISDFPDGAVHPSDWRGPGNPPGCLNDNPDNAGGLMHTRSEATAAGTAFAISYESDISKVTLENLVVFSVLPNSPFRRLAWYDVPESLPPCPPGGCYCAWLWVPDGCGQPNIYMQNFKCHVSGSTSTKQVAPAKPPVYCGDDCSKCVKGAKQMIAWNQRSGNNVAPPGGISPGYNYKMGFYPGAQNDIFL